MSEVSTVLAGARGFKRHPLAPDPHPRSMQGMNTSYHNRKSSITTGRKNGGRSVQFRCPVGRCPRQLPRARTVNLTPLLRDAVNARGLDLHETVQTALEKFGRLYSRQEPLPPREQFPVVVRLKPYQYLLYSGWTPKELSDVVEFALLRFFERTRAAEAGD